MKRSAKFNEALLREFIEIAIRKNQRMKKRYSLIRIASLSHYSTISTRIFLLTPN